MRDDTPTNFRAAVAALVRSEAGAAPDSQLFAGRSPKMIPSPARPAATDAAPRSQLPLVGDAAQQVPAASRALDVANDAAHADPADEPLIPLSAHDLGGAQVQTVDARALHAFLEVGKVFGAWIKERIDQYGFTQGVDYLVSETGIQVPHQGGTRRTTRIDYHLSIDMAKELAMVERNDKGREARRYFIACERRLKESESAPLALPRTYKEALLALVAAEEQKEVLALQNKAQAEALAIAAPKAGALDRLATATDGAVCLRVAAKLAQVPEKQFISFLNQEGWIFRYHHSQTWQGYSDKEKAGLLELKRTSVTRDDGSEKIVEQVLLTPKGQAKAAELVERKAPWLRKAGGEPPRAH